MAELKRTHERNEQIGSLNCRMVRENVDKTELVLSQRRLFIGKRRSRQHPADRSLLVKPLPFLFPDELRLVTLDVHMHDCATAAPCRVVLDIYHRL